MGDAQSDAFEREGDNYTEREMRLMRERDAALTRAEKAEEEMSSYREACMQDERTMIEKKNAVYRERNACVAVMAKLALKLGYPCGLGKHPESDELWDRDWMNIVYIEVPHPSGKPAQLSWHMHDDDMPLFTFLPAYDEKWDGHTTEEKYQHMAEFCGAPL